MLNLPLGWQAALWGGFAGIPLIIGALIGYYGNLRQRTVAGIMAFGSGALISAMAFDLMEQAYEKGGMVSAAIGFVLGAVIYSLANFAISRFGAKHRKRSNINNTINQEEVNYNSTAIAVGALIDGIPESIVIGVGMIEGGVVSLVTVVAVFISNFPEGLSSSAGMKNSGKSLKYILFLWGGIALISPVFAGIGYLFFQNISIYFVSLTISIAAGAILAMIVDTMIPEAFAETHNFGGLITVFGFLCAFILEKL